MRTLDEIIAGLPDERRAAVTSRGQQLIAEERALRHLRMARRLTQENMAELLGVDQGSVSKLEGRADVLLSTLRKFVVAMGGNLRLLAEFPDGTVELSSLKEGDEQDMPAHLAARKKADAPRRSGARKPHLVQAEE